MKRIILSILTSIIFINVYAYTIGTIYTPEGSAIEVLYLSEMLEDEIDYYNTSIAQSYPNATLIGTATLTYNCHSYAWNMTEGGPTCWLNYTTQSGGANLSKYWTDGSYLLTTEENASKIFYYNSDHSAIFKLGDRTKYVSKWGRGPLMEHAPGYGPYNDMESRKYFMKSSDFEPKILSPGYGNYIRNHEYEFFTLEDNDGKYIYIWTISEEQDNGQDAVELGKATFDNDDNPNIAKITFLTGGLYNVTVEIYTADEEFVDRYTCQAYVQ